MTYPTTQSVPPEAPETASNPATVENSPSVRKFSQKIETLAASPKNRGAFFTEDASAKGLALVTAKYKDVKVYWLVDPESDLIYDAKFFSYGGPVSVAMGEMLCSLAKGMKMESACAITIPQIESLLRDNPETPAVAGKSEDVYAGFATLPDLLGGVWEGYPAAKTLAQATAQMKAARANQPVGKASFENLTLADGEWLKKPKEDQIQAVEDVLTRDIRPALNSDGGDMQVQDLEDGYRLTVKYQGACGSCGSSTGATLAFIEDNLRRQLFGGIQVVPVE